MKKKILFFVFKPVKRTPDTMSGLRIWWKQELAQNPEANPTDQFEIAAEGPVNGQDEEEGLKFYNMLIGIRKAYRWFKSAL